MNWRDQTRNGFARLAQSDEIHCALRIEYSLFESERDGGIYMVSTSICDLDKCDKPQKAEFIPATMHCAAYRGTLLPMNRFTGAVELTVVTRYLRSGAGRRFLKAP